MSQANRKTITRKAKPSIAELCQLVKKLRKRADDESKRQSQAYKAVKAAMPEPHPSIVFGPLQKRDGLILPIKNHPNARYIWPQLIEAAIYHAKKENRVERTDFADFFMLRVPTKPAELAPDRQALVARLEARLVLSKEYSALLKRRLKAAGADESKLHALWDHAAEIEAQIVRRKSATLADLSVKISLYAADPATFQDQAADGNSLVISIVEDAARLLKAGKAVQS